MSVNSLLTKKLADMVRKLDATRPVTAGCNEPNPNNHLFRSGALDIIGFNYHDDWFAGVPENFPGKPFIVTESVSGLMTRGYYRMPSDSMFIWPERWDKPFYDASFSCSSYDNCHVPWGNRHEGTMRHVKNNDLSVDNTSGRASIISVSLLLTVGRHVALTLALSTWLASRGRLLYVSVRVRPDKAVLHLSHIGIGRRDKT